LWCYDIIDEDGPEHYCTQHKGKRIPRTNQNLTPEEQARNREDERKANAFVNQHQKCPKCDITVWRQAGCDHITCVCGYEFCYLCRQPHNLGNHANCNVNRFQHLAENSKRSKQQFRRKNAWRGD
jgi:hypothetical protein